MNMLSFWVHRESEIAHALDRIQLRGLDRVHYRLFVINILARLRMSTAKENLLWIPMDSFQMLPRRLFVVVAQRRDRHVGERIRERQEAVEMPARHHTNTSWSDCITEREVDKRLPGWIHDFGVESSAGGIASRRRSYQPEGARHTRISQPAFLNCEICCVKSSDPGWYCCGNVAWKPAPPNMLGNTCANGVVVRRVVEEKAQLLVGRHSEEQRDHIVELLFQAEAEEVSPLPDGAHRPPALNEALYRTGGKQGRDKPRASAWSAAGLQVSGAPEATSISIFVFVIRSPVT